MRLFAVWMILLIAASLWSTQPYYGMVEVFGHLRLLFVLCALHWFYEVGMGQKLIGYFCMSMVLSCLILCAALMGLIVVSGSFPAPVSLAIKIQEGFRSLHGFSGVELPVFGVGGSPFLNRVHWSPLLAFALTALIYCMYVLGRRSLWNWFQLGTGLFLLVLMQGRAGWLVLFLGCLAVSFVGSSLKQRMGKAVGLVVLAFLCIIFVPPVKERVAQIHLGYLEFKEGRYGYGIGDRLIHIATGLEVWKTSPLFGHGTGSYYQINSVFSKKMYPQHEPTSNPHNQYVLQMVEQGLLGLSVLLYLFGAVIHRGWSLSSPGHLLLFMAGAGYAVLGLSSMYLMDQPMQHVFWFMLALGEAMIVNENQRENYADA